MPTPQRTGGMSRRAAGRAAARHQLVGAHARRVDAYIPVALDATLFKYGAHTCKVCQLYLCSWIALFTSTLLTRGKVLHYHHVTALHILLAVYWQEIYVQTSGIRVAWNDTIYPKARRGLSCSICEGQMP